MKQHGMLCFAMSFVFASTFARAQNESRIRADFRREGEALHACGTFNGTDLVNCGETLFTGQPVHIAIGSLAPKNGVAAGLAFVEHKNFPSEWRLAFTLDAVAAQNGSWRAGAYLKSYKFSMPTIGVVYPGPKTKVTKPVDLGGTTSPLFNLYAQGESLNKIDFYGLGPQTTPAGHALFGFTEAILGGSAIIPAGGGLSVVGDLNGRIPSIRGSYGNALPSIQFVYNETTAPGLAQQPAFVQASEGLRYRTSLIGDHLRLNYLGTFQQYVAPSASQYTFRRWNVDVDHQVPFYHTVRRIVPRDQNGPDDCSTSAETTNTAQPCAHITTSQNYEGWIDVRLFMTGSVANAGHAVPFYFDPTLGGLDINANPALPSYPDYRFRAPNIVLLRESIEHSLGKWPIGVLFTADQGNVANRRNDINFSNLRESYGAGITVRAGGLPLIYFMFAWGGNEGTHAIATLSNQLLGSSRRPSLF